ncbi:MAG: glycosyltransferase family 39 protein [Candidatus Promineifilaceae bacterium]
MWDSIGLPLPILIAILVVLLSIVMAAVRSKISRSAQALLVILLIGAALRLRWIEQPYIDYFSWRQSDVAMIAGNYLRSNANIFYPAINWSGPQPGYVGFEFQTVSYLAMLLYRVFGQQDWIGRCIAIAFGVCGIFALYKLVALAWNQNLALLTAALMAILPASVFIERSFLPDPAMVALMTASLWLLVRYLQSDKLFFLIFSLLLGALGALTKITGLIMDLPALYILVVLLPKKPDKQKRLAVIMLSGLLILTVVTLYYLWAWRLAILYPPHHFSGRGNWLWDTSLSTWLAEQYFIPTLFRISRSLLWTLPVLLLTTTGFCYLLSYASVNRHRNDALFNFELPWLFHWWLAACALLYLIGALEVIKNPWNLHLVTPAIAALSALALAAIFRVVQRRTWPPAAVAATIAFLLLLWGLGARQNLSWLYKAQAYEDYLLGRRLQELSEPDDLVVTINHILGNPTAIYYSQRRGWVFPTFTPGVWLALKSPDD